MSAKGCDVLTEILENDSRETRIGLSAAARKAAKTFAKMPSSKVIKHAQAHRHITSSASVLHGWDEKGNPVPFSLNVLSLGNMGIQLGPKRDTTTVRPGNSKRIVFLVCFGRTKAS